MQERLSASEFLALRDALAAGWVSLEDADLARSWAGGKASAESVSPATRVPRFASVPTRAELQKISGELELAIAIAHRELAQLLELAKPKRELLYELMEVLAPGVAVSERDALVRIIDDQDKAISLKRLQIQALEQSLREPTAVFLDRQARSQAAAEARRREREEANAFFAKMSEVTAIPEETVPPPDPAIESRIRSALALMQRFKACSQLLRRRRASPRQKLSEPLSQLDLRLAHEWTAIETDRPTKDSEWLLCKMLSARAAERIASQYYESLGLAAVDVSIAQLDGLSRDWKTHDIALESGPIDVKNARQSLHSTAHYVEHSVPRFKIERNTGAEVRICGILSPYEAARAYYLQDTPAALVLGEVSYDELNQVFRWMERRFGSTLDLSAGWRKNYVPGWQFEYRDRHYQDRHEQIEVLVAVLAEAIHHGFDIAKLPGWALTLAGGRLAEEHRALLLEKVGEKEREFLPQLWQLGREVGLSRRSLSLYAMGLAIEAVLSKLSARSVLHTFRGLLLSGGDATSAGVLWLDDSHQYVLKLIEALDSIASWLRASGIRIVRFRLAHPVILQGLKVDGEWYTLLAYCGGWQSRPIRARCGKAPLFVGLHDHCPSCGKLVCDNCGFCANTCQLCESRQEAFATASGSEDSAFDEE